MFLRNIETVLDTAQPSDWTAGLEWYQLAHQLAQRIAALLGVTLAQAAYAIAALSPRLSWPENVRSINAIAQHIKAGNSQETFAVKLRCTNVNRAKAWAILTTGDLDKIGNGPKTRAFADNILYPQSSRLVTVDGWAYRVAAGLIGKTDEFTEVLRGKLYDEVSAAYIEAADKRGLLPLEIQAIAWVTAHRVEGKPL